MPLRWISSPRAAAETIAGVDLGEVADRLRALKDTAPAEAAAWLREQRQIAQILDRQEGGDNRIYISHHEDELIAVEQGYRAVEAGKPYGQRPEDYLESFKAYLETQSDRLAILNLITTRPRDLKRSDLRQLRLDLDADGFSEADLQSAHRNAR
ncbi:MAG: type I restriction-modification enzyme R subunit C-terminal domain-containing protein, partial [Prochlorotrichaceae cyanobacterium]